MEKIIQKSDLIEIIENASIRDTVYMDINEQMKDQKKNNHFVIFDLNGNEICRTKNKVVSSGKIEQIETMFRQYDISDKYGITYDRPDNKSNPRWISVFGIGSGGAPLSEGNNPYIVNANDTELTAPNVFRNTPLSNQTVRYWDNYRKKDFTKIELNWDKSADDIYALLICDLDFDDCKGQTVNELGIYTCTHVYNGDVISTKNNFTLYAKGNFNSINKSPLDNHSAFRIAYKVFI